MGHEYMELRNTAAAVQCYRNAVAISEVRALSALMYPISVTAPVLVEVTSSVGHPHPVTYSAISG
jgi:hypothetical protein